MHHREHRSREGANRSEQPFQRVVVSDRIAPPARKLVDVLAGGPDIHSLRGAEHDGAHTIGSQSPEGGDDTVGGLGTECVTPALVVESDDANLPSDLQPDSGAFEALRPSGSRNTTSGYVQ